MAKAETTINVMEVNTGTVEFAVVGTSPLICNRMSQKARGQLLLPSGRKTAAEKAQALKHHPLREFRASPYTARTAGPTHLQLLASMFKGALRSAALDVPGAKKAQVGRLTWIKGDRVDLYGKPKMLMSVVRSADIGKTPDIRSRAIIQEWACAVSVTYVKPVLNEQTVANLMAAAGLYIGVGDYRPEKGAGNYGQFRLASGDDPELLRIIDEGGRAAQLQGLADPEPYDDETEELLRWFDDEIDRRGLTEMLA